MKVRGAAALGLVAACAALAEVGCYPPPREVARGETVPMCPGKVPGGYPVERWATHFSAIGDYGLAGPYEESVALLVHCMEPDFIITLGDNNYASGDAAWIDVNIGQYFHAFIFPYLGRFGLGAKENRFFPSLGNHDWYTAGAQPYLDYFQLPGNERYYDFVRGDVHFFALDSDESEPDGVTVDSVQAQWLRDSLAASTAPWRIVYMHHPPYSSGPHGSTPYMQWPFRDWGASLVLAGHDHTYERLVEDGLTYIVSGNGGNPETYPIAEPIPGSAAHLVDEHGALILDADSARLRVRSYIITGQLVDEVVLTVP
jgi:hypothetical protein